MNLMDLFIKIGVDDQASGRIDKITAGIGKGLSIAAGIGLAAVTAAAVGIAKLAKSAIDQYAEYEQLIGGVETLYGSSLQTMDGYIAEFSQKSTAEIMAFQREAGLAVDGIIGPETIAALEKSYAAIGNASETVVQNATNAYKTAGMSANEYMNMVMSFSAVLLQNLGGDTAEAASYADRAIRDMADNANKMGTSMELVQNAYMGFSRGNYTMLDNLNKMGALAV